MRVKHVKYLLVELNSNMINELHFSLNDINLDLLISSPPKQKKSENENDVSVLKQELPLEYSNTSNGYYQNESAIKRIELAKKISKTDFLLTKIENLQKEKLQLVQQLTDFKDIATERHRMYLDAKAIHENVLMEFNKCKEKCDKLDDAMVNKQFAYEQMQAQWDHEIKRPYDYDDLALKYLKIIQKYDSALSEPDLSIAENIKKYCLYKKLDVPLFNDIGVSSTKKSKVRIDTIKRQEQSSQCNLKNHTSEQKAMHNQGIQCEVEMREQETQHISTMTTRGTTTRTCITQHNVGTCFPEPQKLPSVESILEEISQWKVQRISPIKDLTPESCRIDLKTYNTVGTCTWLCNINRKIGFFPQQYTLPKIRQSTRYQHIKKENETPKSSPIPKYDSATLMEQFNKPIESENFFHKNYRGTNSAIFEGLWQVFGKIVCGLLQQNNSNVIPYKNNLHDVNQQEFHDWLQQLHDNINFDQNNETLNSTRNHILDKLESKISSITESNVQMEVQEKNSLDIALSPIHFLEYPQLDSENIVKPKSIRAVQTKIDSDFQREYSVTDTESMMPLALPNRKEKAKNNIQHSSKNNNVQQHKIKEGKGGDTCKQHLKLMTGSSMNSEIGLAFLSDSLRSNEKSTQINLQSFPSNENQNADSKIQHSSMRQIKKRHRMERKRKNNTNKQHLELLQNPLTNSEVNGINVQSLSSHINRKPDSKIKHSSLAQINPKYRMEEKKNDGTHKQHAELLKTAVTTSKVNGIKIQSVSSNVIQNIDNKIEHFSTKQIKQTHKMKAKRKHSIYRQHLEILKQPVENSEVNEIKLQSLPSNINQDTDNKKQHSSVTQVKQRYRMEEKRKDDIYKQHLELLQNPLTNSEVNGINVQSLPSNMNRNSDSKIKHSSLAQINPKYRKEEKKDDGTHKQHAELLKKRLINFKMNGVDFLFNLSTFQNGYKTSDKELDVPVNFINKIQQKVNKQKDFMGLFGKSNKECCNKTSNQPIITKDKKIHPFDQLTLGINNPKINSDILQVEEPNNQTLTLLPISESLSTTNKINSHMNINYCNTMNAIKLQSFPSNINQNAESKIQHPSIRQIKQTHRMEGKTKDDTNEQHLEPLKKPITNSELNGVDYLANLSIFHNGCKMSDKELDVPVNFINKIQQKVNKQEDFMGLFGKSNNECCNKTSNQPIITKDKKIHPFDQLTLSTNNPKSNFDILQVEESSNQTLTSLPISESLSTTNKINSHMNINYCNTMNAIKLQSFPSNINQNAESKIQHPSIRQIKQTHRMEGKTKDDTNEQHLEPLKKPITNSELNGVDFLTNLSIFHNGCKMSDKELDVPVNFINKIQQKVNKQEDFMGLFGKSNNECCNKTSNQPIITKDKKIHPFDQLTLSTNNPKSNLDILQVEESSNQTLSSLPISESLSTTNKINSHMNINYCNTMNAIKLQSFPSNINQNAESKIQHPSIRQIKQTHRMEGKTKDDTNEQHLEPLKKPITNSELNGVDFLANLSIFHNGCKMSDKELDVPVNFINKIQQKVNKQEDFMGLFGKSNNECCNKTSNQPIITKDKKIHPFDQLTLSTNNPKSNLDILQVEVSSNQTLSSLPISESLSTTNKINSHMNINYCNTMNAIKLQSFPSNINQNAESKIQHPSIRQIKQTHRMEGKTKDDTNKQHLEALRKPITNSELNGVDFLGNLSIFHDDCKMSDKELDVPQNFMNKIHQDVNKRDNFMELLTKSNNECSNKTSNQPIITKDKKIHPFDELTFGTNNPKSNFDILQVEEPNNQILSSLPISESLSPTNKINFNMNIQHSALNIADVILTENSQGADSSKMNKDNVKQNVNVENDNINCANCTNEIGVNNCITYSLKNCVEILDKKKQEEHASLDPVVEDINKSHFKTTQNNLPCPIDSSPLQIFTNKKMKEKTQNAVLIIDEEKVTTQSSVYSEDQSRCNSMNSSKLSNLFSSGLHEEMTDSIHDLLSTNANKSTTVRSIDITKTVMSTYKRMSEGQINMESPNKLKKSDTLYNLDLSKIIGRYTNITAKREDWVTQLSNNARKKDVLSKKCNHIKDTFSTNYSGNNLLFENYQNKLNESNGHCNSKEIKYNSESNLPLGNFHEKPKELNKCCDSKEIIDLIPYNDTNVNNNETNSKEMDSYGKKKHHECTLNISSIMHTQTTSTLNNSLLGNKSFSICTKKGVEDACSFNRRNSSLQFLELNSPSSPEPMVTSNNNLCFQDPTIIPLYYAILNVNNWKNSNRALLDQLIDNYDDNVYKEFSATRKTKVKRYVKVIQESVIGHLQDFCNTDNFNNGNAMASELIKHIQAITTNYEHIYNAVIMIAKDAPRSDFPEKDMPSVIQERPPRHLSKVLQRLDFILKYFIHFEFNFGSNLMSRIEQLLFNTQPKKRITITQCLHLTQLYLMACELYKNNLEKHPARRFITNCLYYYKNASITMIYEVLMWCPTVLPPREERTYNRSDVIITIIQHILMNTKYDMENAKVRGKGLLSKLRFEYHFQPFKPNKTDVITFLMEKLKRNELQDIQYAFVVLCKRMTPSQTITLILNEHIVPLVKEYYEFALIDDSYDTRLSTLISTMAAIIKPFPLETDISSYLNFFTPFLYKIDRPMLQECAVRSILSLRRFGFFNCYKVLRNYKPDCAYALCHNRTTLAILNSFIYSKPKKFWNRILSNLELNDCV